MCGIFEPHMLLSLHPAVWNPSHTFYNEANIKSTLPKSAMAFYYHIYPVLKGRMHFIIIVKQPTQSSRCMVMAMGWGKEDS